LAALGDPAHQPGVRALQVVEDPSPPRLVYDPGHPDADAQGYVAYPNVNPILEMVDLTTATRAYEANVQVMNATKRLADAALQIGG
jgi:flagellar basal-body rod protein FlgC